MSSKNSPVNSPKHEEEELCSICASSIKWLAFGECNHSICHICSLRLRSLYKTLACPMCKTECATVIFASPKGGSDDAEEKRLFQDFKQPIMKRDKKLGIFFENQLAYDDAMSLLVFNCPEPQCTVVCSGGWNDLKNHVKGTHGLLLCDVCITNKKIFSHECKTFTPLSLKKHIKTGDKDDQSFKGHPECSFCNLRFYGNDELYEHCRQNHEECFLCQRQGIRFQYFHDYSKLEEHFSSEHFPCKEPACLEKKFVIFASDLDYQGHMLKEHTDTKDKSKGRQIKLEFNYSSSSTTRRNDQERRKGRSQSEEGYNGQGSSSDNISQNFSDEGNAGRRIRAPAGFGSQLTAVPVAETMNGNSSSSSSSPSRPNGSSSSSQQPGPSFSDGRARRNNNDDFPLPTPFQAPEISVRQPKQQEYLLTPAQNDILVCAGVEIILQLQKLIGSQVETMAKFKLSLWQFRAGNSSADSFLNDFYSWSFLQNPHKKPPQLLTEMGLVWHRIADTLPEEASSEQIHRALEKKSKKKGLTIQEFEALQKGEPKKISMLRVWNNHKVKILQSETEIMPRKQSSWAASDPPPPLSSSKSSGTSARVMVIKPTAKGKGVVGSSSWAASSSARASPVASPLVVASAGNDIPISNLDLSSVESVDDSSLAVIVKAKPLNRSESEFPTLPQSEKPARMTVAKLRQQQMQQKQPSTGGYYGNVEGPSRAQNWNEVAVTQSPEVANGGGSQGQGKKKKKEKVSLLHFG